MARARLITAELDRIDGFNPKTGVIAGKHHKMAANPFRFLRGSAQLFYADIKSGLLPVPDSFASVPHTRIMGDCHFSNFGFLTEEGSHNDTVIFAPNDFDDAAMGPAVWDLLRYLTSMDLIADYLNGIRAGLYTAEEDIPVDAKGISLKALNKAKTAFLDIYAESCALMKGDPAARRQALDSMPDGHFLEPFLKKAQKRAVGGSRFMDKSTIGKLTCRNDQGALVFIDDAARFRRVSAPQYRALHNAFRPYLDDQVLDIVARHGAGTGSVNVERYYFLVGPDAMLEDADLHLAHVVEVKQQREAAPIHHFPDLCPENRMSPAHLTVDCQQRMMRKPDLVLDEVTWKRQPWLVRSRHHARLGVDPETLLFAPKPGRALRDYALACGHALARAHARGDRRSTRFEAAMRQALKQGRQDLLTTSTAYAVQASEDQTWLAGIIADSADSADRADRPAA